MNDLFYVLGGVLVLLAVVLSFLGMRSEKFPDSRGALFGGLTLMGVFVIATCAWAISLAREEADHRSHEFEEFFADQEAEEGGEQAPSAEAEEQEPADAEPSKSAALALTSPAAGDLIFDPTTLDAKAGEVAVEYTNPSSVPHNVAIEADGAEVGISETVTDGASATATAELDPGTYTFYCAIPGHRESGMEGELTVK